MKSDRKNKFCSQNNINSTEKSPKLFKKAPKDKEDQIIMYEKSVESLQTILEKNIRQLNINEVETYQR